jgi:glycerol-3-phosphate dehydrogenase
MAEDTLDRAIAVGKLRPARDCWTEQCPLIGAETYHHTDWQKLMEQGDVEEDIARHLTQSYGDQAQRVVDLMRQGFFRRLAEGYPYVEAEVVYAAQSEYACTPADVLLRRTRLSTLDQAAAEAALPKVTLLMAQQLAWDQAKQTNLQQEAMAWIQ